MTAIADDVSTIGPLQLKIMFALWRHPELKTVHNVHSHLNAVAEREAAAGSGGKPVLAYTTYLTVMRNLVRRQLLSQSKGQRDRFHTFAPLISEDEYITRLLTHVNTTVFGSDKGKFVAAVTAITTPAITFPAH